MKAFFLPLALAVSSPLFAQTPPEVVSPAASEPQPVFPKVSESADKPNMLAFYGGYGQDGLTTTTPSGGPLEVKPFYGLLVGTSYSRKVFGDWFLSGLGLYGTQGHSYSVLVGGGYNW